jgi:DNA gyrase subunit A
MGVINLKVGGKTGEVIAVKQVAPDDEVIFITQNGKILRTPVGDIRLTSGRAAQGVKLMDLDPGDRLVAAAKLAEREEEDDGEPAEAAPGDAGEPGDDAGETVH